MLRFLLIDYVDLTDDITNLLDVEVGYCDVLATPNGQIGLEMALEHRPHLIYCHELLPGICGYTVVEKLYQEDPLLLNSFIFCSKSSVRSQKWLQTRFEPVPKIRFLERPFTIEEFLTWVYAILGRPKLTNYQYPIEEGGQRLFTSK
jgi:CheY-like chemotaxis protein